MEYLLVVYFLMSGVWVHGAELEGWGPIAYPTEALASGFASIHREERRLWSGMFHRAAANDG